MEESQLNMTRIVTMVIAAACLLACMPGVSASGNQGNSIVPSTGDHAITIDQAKDSVRVYLGDMSLEPQYFGEGESIAGCHYWFEVKNTTFLVNADTGVVEGVRFQDNEPASSPEIKIDRNAAYATAQEYAVLKCDNFRAKTWALVVDKIAGPADGIRGYVFAFREEIRSGNDSVLLPNIALVSVNPETGAIISYVAINRLPIDGSEMTPEQKAFNDDLDHIDEHITSS
jgi:hypothetical protein